MILLHYHLLMICPLPNIAAANQACVDVTGLPAAADTFTPENVMLKNDTPYACAGVYVSAEEYAQLDALADQLGGAYWVLKTQDESGWRDVKTLKDCMDENNLTRPDPEKEDE